ncbi:hypothetical protein [Xylanimonas ulmi]|uniref:ABC transporter ATP-binding protein n=1 Tax=Xylanimonas ulmi TaxID=228973 RepID=UPI0030FE2F67
MYRGKVVEVGPTEQIFTDPQHEYTRALLSAIPIADPRRARAWQTRLGPSGPRGQQGRQED